MKRLIPIPFLLFLPLFLPAQLSVGRLRCQQLSDPVGMDQSHPKLSWELKSKDKNILQTAYRILVSKNPETLHQQKGEIWDSHKIFSGQSIQVTYKGPPLQSAVKYYWKIQVWDNKGRMAESEIASWQMGLLAAADWYPAKWIAMQDFPDSARIVPAEHGNGKKEWGKRPDILPLFRKEFPVRKKIKQGLIFISGLGQFEVYINGQKTGDHFMDPGWTQYEKQAQYVTFDITTQLQEGNNAAAVMLGNGFYYISGERYRKMTGAFGFPKMIARILIRYEDGSHEVVVSNESWKTTASPVTYSGIYGGENYDARLEQKGWNLPGFNDNEWQNALPAASHPLVAQSAAPVKLVQQKLPVRENKIGKFLKVYDLGQNMSGIPEIRISGHWGDSIRITPAELVKEDGTVNQRATGSPHYFLYVSREGEATWKPRFTYSGFRYLQVEIIPVDTSKPTEVLSVKAWHNRNSAAVTGSFRCDNELFNQTFSLIKWAINSNMQSIFTDCPHRERLGWQEQLHLMGNALQHNYDIHSLYKKIAADIRAEQNSNGLIPSTVPEYTQMHFADGYFRDSPEWGMSVILLPWNLYKWYGDKEELERTYPHMQRYLAYLDSKDSSGLLMYGLSDWYDLGPQRPGFCQLTPMGLTATAYYYHGLVTMQQIAALLGKKQDIQFYSKQAAFVKASFLKKYYQTATGQYGSGSQTSNAVALSLGLVDASNRKKVLANLIRDIEGRNHALTSGDIGFHHLLSVLSAAGRDDIIYKMNNRTDVPGYGYQIRNGATALTESWQGLPIVSNNHFMLGHLMDWFYTGLAGIQQTENSVGFKEFLIRPRPVGDIQFANAHYHSVYGELISSWKIEKEIFLLDIQVPANTRATLYLPGQTKPVKLGSGQYHYQIKLK